MKKKYSFFLLPLFVCALIIIVFLSQQIFDYNFFQLGILPRHFLGLKGILFSPLIHADIEHLLSNLSALPVLLTLLTILHRRNYATIFLVLYISTGLLVWCFARESYHIGASGIIYALASFLFFAGIISDKKGSSAISLLTIILYGSMVWGIFPNQPHISWESHALGAVAGFVSAFVFIKENAKKILTDKDFDFQTLQFKSFSQTKKYEKITYQWKMENSKFKIEN